MLFWICCLFLGLPDVNVHDFHLSKADINFDSQEEALQISIHLFIDDLEGALLLKGHEDLGICTGKETAEAENAISDYLKDHFMVSLGGETLTLEWVGKEISDDLAGVWCYLEISEAIDDREYGIENTLLLELYDDQRNIVKVSADHKRVSYFLMDAKEHQGEFEL